MATCYQNLLLLALFFVPGAANALQPTPSLARTLPQVVAGELRSKAARTAIRSDLPKKAEAQTRNTLHALFALAARLHAPTASPCLTPTARSASPAPDQLARDSRFILPTAVAAGLPTYGPSSHPLSHLSLLLPPQMADARDLEAAFGAAAANLQADRDRAAAAFQPAALANLVERFGVYIAKEERSGPLQPIITHAWRRSTASQIARGDVHSPPTTSNERLWAQLSAHNPALTRESVDHWPETP